MSTNLSKIIPISSENESTIENGVVTSVSDNSIKILFSGDIINAKKAFSCIIDPEAGDTVLCCKNNCGTTYILAIIERQKNNKMKLSFPSDATFKSVDGNLNFFSNKSLNMAAENLNSFSKKTIHKSNNAYISFDEIVANGNEIQASYKTVRLVANLINTMARQVIDKFKGYIRHTEDNDQVHAGQLTRRTDGLFSMDSRNTVMISKKETKIDGEKIYMA